MRILVVEDEKDLNKIITKRLQNEGYSVDSCFDGEQALLFLSVGEFDAVIMDIMMPVLSGIEVLKKMRSKDDTTPVLLLTAKDSIKDKVKGLDIGADDYISKPYNAQVLLARIQKLLARTYEIQDNVVLTHKGLTLNLPKAEISYQGQRKSLTKNEMRILRLLMVNKGNIIPRDAIIDELWQSEQFIDENTLNVNIVRLRKTLAEIGLPDYLETKRGLGYCV